MLNKQQSLLAIDLYEAGIIKIDIENGFKLKGHEKNPDMPLSPVYINLRFNRWSNKLPIRIGSALYSLIKKEELKFDAIAGIPSTGQPLAKAFNLRHLIEGSCDTYPTINLTKKASDTKREVVYTGKKSDVAGKRILLIDDVISGGNSAIEAARAIELAGGNTAGIVVLVDRNQAGTHILRTMNYTTYSYLPLKKMIHLYWKARLIQKREYYVIKEYLNKTNT